MGRFNIRVYGIYINESDEILLSDERIGNFCFTKFPGGGLEWGEGIIDCLIREWKEELDTAIEVIEHIYTTDFFQQSAFDDSQVISIYYKVKPQFSSDYLFKSKIFDFENTGHKENVFRWKRMSDLEEDDLTFPIDKKVLMYLK